MTRSGRPVLASVWRKPSDIASTDTSTPTTPAIPTTTTSEVPSRAGSVRRLSRVISAIWWSERIARAQRWPASASTIRSRFARRAGGSPMASASAATMPAPVSQVSAVT